MTLSLINSNQSSDLPPWSLQTIILEPYLEGGRHLLQVFAKTHSTDGPSPKQRFFHLVTGASLILPIVNIVIYVALRYFVKPPSSHPQAEPQPDPPKPEEAKIRFEQEVQKVQSRIARIPNEKVKEAVKDYVDFIVSSTKKFIDVQSEQSTIQLIHESVADELANIASEINEIPLGDQDDLEETQDAVLWQKYISEAMQQQTAEVERLIDEGQTKSFINQRFSAWYGATLFTHVSKLNRFIPYIQKLQKCGSDPAQRDFFGNTGLMWACANASNEMAKEIMNVFGPGPYLDIQCRRGNSALHLVVGKGYKDKSRDGQKLTFSNLDLLKLLIAKKAQVNLADKNGNTPLHLAYLRRDQEMVEELIKAGADQNCTNKQGQKPSELLKATYAEATELLRASVIIFLLDQNEFERANFGDAKKVLI